MPQPDDERPDDDDRPTLLLVTVDDTYDGQMELETTDGATHTERALFLDLACLVGETGVRMPVTLCVPVSAGPKLLRSLLTEDQWEAVIHAD